MTGDVKRATRDRLIDATVTLLRAKGAAGSGTKEILDLAEAPRGSFYFHFPQGKDQLVLEAMRRAAAGTLAALESALADEQGDLAEQVTAIFEAIADDLDENDYVPGCAVAVTTMESASISPQFQQAVANAFSSWTTAVAARLVGRGVPAEQAHMLADAIVAAMEGATVLARARRDPRPLRHASAALRLAIPHIGEQ